MQFQINIVLDASDERAARSLMQRLLGVVYTSGAEIDAFTLHELRTAGEVPKLIAHNIEGE